ncbi:MAG TPA: hypothetical protein VE549_14230 [Myxococcaceae bacterium]|nr:hypothetical protein [Myxococcaceae bacterium]
MADTSDPRFLDKRTAERYIRLGLLDEKVWEKHLKSLPDSSDKAAEVETAIGADDEDEDGAYGGDAGEETEEPGHVG